MGILILAASPALGVEDKDCFVCHGEANMTKTLPDASVKSLYVEAAVFGTSVHAKEGCTSCHADAAELPHEEGLAKVNCGSCHDEAQPYEKSPHGQLLKNGGKDVNGCSDCHGVHDIRAASDPLSHTYPRNLPETCGRCHSNPALVKSHMISILNPSDSYLKSAHALAILKGNLASASCTTCHGTHDLLPAYNPASRVYRRNVPATCGKCHANELADYQRSIHGRAMTAGIKDAPVCTDCHGEHDIEAPNQKTSKVSPRQIVTQTCTRCHDNETVMSRYGVVTGRQASYMDSYHGLASAAGSEVVASCASCHEAHRVLPQSDPESSIYPANLPGTCGKCHKNAGPHFARGAVHIMPTDPGQKALGIVRLIYIVLITVIIGGMIMHNTLSMARRAAIKFRQELGGRNTFRRFTVGMTVGHLVLTAAFIVLAVSGFALRYPEAWWARQIFHGEAGLAARGVVHRVAALVLVGLAIVNAVFLLGTRSGRKELGRLLLGINDLKDVFRNLSYMVGIAKEPPRFDRYNYMEKFEYWGMWWGTLLMILTGFSMWFVNTFLKFLPKIALDIVALIHFYEAWLAVLTIIVWHLYYMVFDPQTYPMNWSWITGHITLEDFKERHPLEYTREMKPAASTAGDAANRPAAPVNE
jgi:cytochrome b subunit of formate dehydrogenase